MLWCLLSKLRWLFSLCSSEKYLTSSSKQIMQGEVQQLHHLWQVVHLVHRDQPPPDKKVKSHRTASDLVILGWDDVHHLLHRDQLPVVHLPIIVTWLESLWKLQIKDELCTRMNSSLWLVEERHGSCSSHLDCQVFRNIRLFPSLLYSCVKNTQTFR